MATRGQLRKVWDLNSTDTGELWKVLEKGNEQSKVSLAGKVKEKNRYRIRSGNCIAVEGAVLCL